MADLAGAVAEAVGKPITEPVDEPSATLIWETDLTELERPTGPAPPQPGDPAALSCPECGGGMNRIDTSGTVHYRCHVGHSFAPQTLLSAQSHTVESALWRAVAILEEQAAVRRELAERAAARHRYREEHAYLAEADQAMASAAAMRGLIQG
jgi:two-component system chemotaxis response regulator CheB